MSLYTPVFPSSPNLRSQNRARQPSASSTSGSLPNDIYRYAEFLRDTHLFLSTKNEVLAPPSCPSSPTSEARALQLRTKVQEAFHLAGGEPSNGKWAYVSDKLRMGCVRGRYRWVKRMKTQTHVTHEQWALPDTEEAWFDWEKAREDARQKEHVEETHGRQTSRVKRVNGTRVVRDPPHNGGPHISEKGKSAPAGSNMDRANGAANVNEKIRRWIDTMDAEGNVQEQVPSQLGFQVLKRVAAPTVIGKKGKGPPGRRATDSNGDIIAGSNPAGLQVRNRTLKILDLPEPPQPPSFPSQLETSTPLQNPVIRAKALVSNHVSSVIRNKRSELPGRPIVLDHQDSPDPSSNHKDRPIADPNGDINTTGSNPGVAALQPHNHMPKISDLPEPSQPPPPFPSQLVTSTPLQKSVVREKPPVSPNCIPLSPSSSPNLYSADVPIDLGNSNVSSSLPTHETPRMPSKKRYRSSTPLSGAKAVSPQVLTSPPRKKMRPTSESSVATPQSSRLSQRPSIANYRGLGNAKNLPMPETPERDLPTLSELLASSRRSKRRPRPPSRKGSMSAPQEPNQVTDNEASRGRYKTPSMDLGSSPSRSFFSSPASGQSDSPGALAEEHRLRSVTPMISYTQNPGAFMPQYTSSQQPHFGRADTLGRMSSGHGLFGYSSQFDVEGQVDRVNELLEKDVDFDGWLRRTPLMEE